MSEERWKSMETMSKERWKLWKERWSSMAPREELGQATRDAVNVAVKAMEAAEKCLND